MLSGRNRRKQKRLLGSLSAAAGLFLLVSCGEDPRPELPVTRSERLLEIFRLLDMKEYKAALPKIEQYRQLDETNAFLGEMRNITITNICIQEAGKLAEDGKLTEACKVIEVAIMKYGELSGLINARKAYQEVLSLRQQIDILKKPQTSKVMSARAAELMNAARAVKSKALQDFAKQAEQDSFQQAKLETDRAYFLIYADAADNIRDGNLREALALTAGLHYLNQQSFTGMLCSGGLFCVPENAKE